MLVSAAMNLAVTAKEITSVNNVKIQIGNSMHNLILQCVSNVEIKHVRNAVIIMSVMGAYKQMIK